MTTTSAIWDRLIAHEAEQAKSRAAYWTHYGAADWTRRAATLDRAECERYARAWTHLAKQLKRLPPPPEPEAPIPGQGDLLDLAGDQ